MFRFEYFFIIFVFGIGNIFCLGSDQFSRGDEGCGMVGVKGIFFLEVDIQEMRRKGVEGGG